MDASPAVNPVRFAELFLLWLDNRYRVLEAMRSPSMYFEVAERRPVELHNPSPLLAEPVAQDQSRVAFQGHPLRHNGRSYIVVCAEGMCITMIDA